jgi:hypothetical protein
VRLVEDLGVNVGGIVDRDVHEPNPPLFPRRPAGERPRVAGSAGAPIRCPAPPTIRPRFLRPM